MNAPSRKPKAAAETVEQVLEKIDDRMSIWKALSRTDPEATKGFQRAGGFSGTAVKPIWVVKRLTEQFGPCGEGWGIGEPKFEVVPAGGNEMLVYCWVSCWHTSPENVLWGVGGDKVVTARKNGPFTDDEAFKKAFTDAVNNAFKFIGVAADIHMGLFDDNKYVAQVRNEFHPPAPVGEARKEGEMSDSALKGSLRMLVHNINGCATIADFEDLLDTDDAKEVIDLCKRRMPHWYETGVGLPEEFVPLKKLIEQTRAGLQALETENA